MTHNVVCDQVVSHFGFSHGPYDENCSEIAGWFAFFATEEGLTFLDDCAKVYLQKNIICKCLSPGKPAMEWGEKPREWVTVILPLRSLVRYIEKCVWVSARYWKSLRWCSFIRTVENRTDFLLLDSLLIHALSFHNKNHCFSYFTSSCWRLRFLHLRNAASTGWVYRSF